MTRVGLARGDREPEPAESAGDLDPQAVQEVLEVVGNVHMAAAVTCHICQAASAAAGPCWHPPAGFPGRIARTSGACRARRPGPRRPTPSRRWQPAAARCPGIPRPAPGSRRRTSVPPPAAGSRPAAGPGPAYLDQQCQTVQQCWADVVDNTSLTAGYGLAGTGVV
jgi:hypothetical protein